EQTCMNPAVPQTGRLDELRVRGVIHFDQDHLVGNDLRNEDEGEVITQGRADLKTPETETDQDSESRSDYPAVHVGAEFGVRFHLGHWETTDGLVSDAKDYFERKIKCLFSEVPLAIECQ